MKKKTRLNLTETQTCHPEFISGSYQQTKEKKILKQVQNDMSFPCKKRAGFTLAETLITLTVIGIIAVITVPAIISKHTESANRTKVKKAMSVYDTAINKMVIENGIKDNTALVSTAGTLENNCAGSSTYFKMAQGSGCEFKTSDGLWWNIEDITHPIVAFKQADLTAEKAAGDNKDAFYFVGRIDETTGILRVNDYISEAEPNKGYLTKLYNFVKPEVGGAEADNAPAFTTVRPRTICDDIYNTTICYQYDEYGRNTGWGSKCSGNTLNSCNGHLVYSYADGVITRGSGCSGTLDTCTRKSYSTYDPQTAGWETGSNCNSDGENCLEYYSYENGIKTVYQDGCPDNDRSKCTSANVTYTHTYDPTSQWFKTTGFYCDSQGKNCEGYYTYNNGVITEYGDCPGDTVDSCTEGNIWSYIAYDEDTGREIGYCEGPNLSSCEIYRTIYYDD